MAKDKHTPRSEDDHADNNDVQSTDEPQYTQPAPTKQEVSTEKEEASDNTHSTASSPSRSGGGLHKLLTLVLLILVILVMIYMAYQWQTKASSNSQAAQAVSSLSQQVKQQASQQQTAINQLQSEFTHSQQAINAQKQSNEATQASITHLLNSISTNQNGWLIEEAKHLLRLANITLYFEHNVPVTVTILKAADQRLYSIGNPQLFPIRKAIGDDIATLNAVPKVDVAGIYIQLQALQQQAARLSLIKNTFTPETADNLIDQQKIEGNSIWHHALNQTTYALGKLMIIRHRKQPIEPLISPEQNMLLAQNVYLLFSQAQWALLHRNPTIYNSGLKQIASYIAKYYEANNESTAMIKTINQLATINIKPALPGITDVLDLLNQYQRQQQNETLQSNKPATQSQPSTHQAAKQ